MKQVSLGESLRRSLRRHRGWPACLSALIAIALAGCAGPHVEFADSDSLSRAELDRTDLIINHWATWCAPCRIEIPELNELAESADYVPFRVLGFNEDFATGQELLDDIAEMDIEFPVLTRNPTEIWGYETPRVLPTTVIIARGGEVKLTLVGPQTKASLLEALQQLHPARS